MATSVKAAEPRERPAACLGDGGPCGGLVAGASHFRGGPHSFPFLRWTVFERRGVLRQCGMELSHNPTVRGVLGMPRGRK